MMQPLSRQQSSRAIPACEADEAEDNMPPELTCPISQAPLRQPVRLGPDGKHLFSQDALMEWARHQVAQGQVPTDPLTRQPLAATPLVREPTATDALNRLRRRAATSHDHAGNAAAADALRKLADDCEALDQEPVPQLPTLAAAPQGHLGHLGGEPTPEDAEPRVRDILAFTGVLTVQAAYYTTRVHPGHLPDALMGLLVPMVATAAMGRVLCPSPRRYLVALLAGPAADIALSYAMEGAAPFAGVVVGIAALVLDRPPG